MLINYIHKQYKYRKNNIFLKNFQNYMIICSYGSNYLCNEVTDMQIKNRTLQKCHRLPFSGNIP